MTFACTSYTDPSTLSRMGWSGPSYRLDTMAESWLSP